MITLGSFAYLLYHRPVGRLKTCLREGGPVEQWKTERGRREMEAAAWQLPSIGPKDEEPESAAADGDSARRSRGQTKGLKGPENSPLATSNSSPETGGKPFEIHMLVGTRFWFMAAFALVSLKRQIDRALHVHLHDDGTLEAPQREKLETLAAAVTFHDRARIDERMEQYLPEEKFPFIRERLRNYPNLKKLTDPHVGSTGPKLVMDADVLFFGRPVELLRWCDQPNAILCATDVTESYGYSRALMERLTGARVPEAINVGITGLWSEGLDWEKIERWCRELITSEGTSYYLEQALVAMLCAEGSFEQLALERYITGPSDEEVLREVGVMQHYVDLSKKNYFRHAWRVFVKPA